MNTINRLQFRHHDEVFENRKAAIDYIVSDIRYSDVGLISGDPSYGLSLYGEPTVLRYKNEDDENEPHVILAIGSRTNEEGRYTPQYNKFCIIDIDNTESEIAKLSDELEKAIKSLTIVALDSNTLALHADKTDEGTVVSGDVKVPDAYVFEGDRIYKENSIIKTENGIFAYVNLEYDSKSDKFIFTVNNNTQEFQIENNYVVSGEYTPDDESIHLHMKHGEDIVVDLDRLIAEWIVEGEAAKSPIILKREEVGYGEESSHHHVEPWQDILSADVRIADDRANNILKKSNDNRYLYVDGVASNIAYYKNGVKSNVQDALDNLSGLKLSTDSNNILTTKMDGFFASTKLEYISDENTLVFTTSTNDEDERKKETRIKLNSFSLFERIDYIASREVLVITYIDGNGKTQFVEIPIGEMIADWEWTVNNYGHSVFLQKERKVQGSDQLSADVNISKASDNILKDANHELYVKGTADNIKYGNGSTVETEIGKLYDKDSALDNKINIETSRAEAAEQTLDGKIASEQNRAEGKETEISNTIGDGFSTDAHETVTYKFNELSEKVDSEIERSTAKDNELERTVTSEITRSTDKDNELDGKINAVDEKIGDGFNSRNTVRDEIDSLKEGVASAKELADSKIADIINNDHSINIDKEDAVKPTISVNLSSEVEDNKPNIIKINSDGLYAGVDLLYEFNEEVGTNQLIFKTTNGTKTYDLKTNSVIDKIYYDSNREAIIIEYTINGHRMPDVVIPVGDLINEWRIWDGHEGGVQLEKQRIASGTSEQDVLKATVVISNTHSDNLLVNDNGALYVSGKGISENAEAISSEANRATEAENALSDRIDSEIERATEAENVLGAKIDSEIERATSREHELDERIDEVGSECLINFTNTNTIAISKNPSLKGYNVLANVNIDNSSDNIIKETANGIYSLVDLTYDSTSNKLVFKNTNGSKEIALVSNSVVDKIYYDAADEAIVIEYTVNGHRMPDVVVPVRDLINEIDVASTETIELVKTVNSSTGADIISANAKLNTYHNDNILVNDGGLYVSGSQISTNKENIENLNRELTAEIERSTSIDADLNTRTQNNTLAISQETERATRVEGELSNRIDEVDAKTFSLSVDDTTTIDLTYENDKISGNVVLANGSNNIIKATSDTLVGSGLYASVDLEYNPATNKLKLVTSSSEKEIALNAGTIIKSIEYDSVGKNLIIKYDVDTGGVTHEESVFVPVEDLFNDWRVQEDHLGAIILHKDSGVSGAPDTLRAEIVISSLSDNMVINDMGSLYVSRKPIDDVSGQVETLREDFEESLAVEDTDTLHLERRNDKTLKGDVKISTNLKNLIEVDEINKGIFFSGDIDCGTY